MERDYHRGNAGATMERGMVQNGDWRRWCFDGASKEVACASMANRWSSLYHCTSSYVRSSKDLSGKI